MKCIDEDSFWILTWNLQSFVFEALIFIKSSWTLWWVMNEAWNWFANIFECVWRLGMNCMCMIFVKNQHAPPQWVISVFVFDWSLLIPILCRKFSVHLRSKSSVAKVFYKLKSTESKTFKYSFQKFFDILHQNHRLSSSNTILLASLLLLIFLLNLYQIYLRHTNQSYHFLPLKMTLFSSKNEINVILQHWLTCNRIRFKLYALRSWRINNIVSDHNVRNEEPDKDNPFAFKNHKD